MEGLKEKLIYITLYLMVMLLTFVCLGQFEKEGSNTKIVENETFFLVQK